MGDRRFRCLFLGLTVLLAAGCSSSGDAESGDETSGATMQPGITTIDEDQGGATALAADACELVGDEAMNTLASSLLGSSVEWTGAVVADPYYAEGECGWPAGFTGGGSSPGAFAYTSPGGACGFSDSAGQLLGVTIGSADSPIVVDHFSGCALVDGQRLIVLFGNAEIAQPPEADAAWIQFFEKVLGR